MAACGGLNLLVILGSVRDGRNAVRVGKYVRKFLEKRSHKVTILDPKELGIVEVKQPLHFHKNPADAPEILHTVNKQIQSADGFFVVAAEYNSQIAPALSSLMDNFPTASYSYRPSAIVTYSVGGNGGIRAAMQMRQYLSELQTVHMPSMIVIPKVMDVLDEEGEVKGDGSALTKATEATAKQFEWYAGIIKKEREVNGKPK